MVSEPSFVLTGKNQNSRIKLGNKKGGFSMLVNQKKAVGLPIGARAASVPRGKGKTARPYLFAVAATISLYLCLFLQQVLYDVLYQHGLYNLHPYGYLLAGGIFGIFWALLRLVFPLLFGWFYGKRSKDSLLFALALFGGNTCGEWLAEWGTAFAVQLQNSAIANTSYAWFFLSMAAACGFGCLFVRFFARYGFPLPDKRQQMERGKVDAAVLEKQTKRSKLRLAGFVLVTESILLLMSAPVLSLLGWSEFLPEEVLLFLLYSAPPFWTALLPLLFSALFIKEALNRIAVALLFYATAAAASVPEACYRLLRSFLEKMVNLQIPFLYRYLTLIGVVLSLASVFAAAFYFARRLADTPEK